MKRGARVILAILISVLLCGIFTLLSFTNLFSLIETGIYFPNLKSQAESDFSLYKNVIEDYFQNSLAKFGDVVKQRFVSDSFLTNQTADVINRQITELNGLLRDNPELISIRLIDPAGKRINFSTLDTDIETATATYRKYKTLDQTDPLIAGSTIAVKEGDSPKIIFESENQNFLFLFPVLDPNAVLKGSALFTVKKNELERLFITQKGLFYRDIKIIGSMGIVVDLSDNLSGLSKGPDLVLLDKTFVDSWTKLTAPSLQTEILRIGATQERMVLYSQSVTPNGFFGILYPAAKFEMGAMDKIIILVVLYITVFLLVFLFINLKQEPMTVVAQRMHKFQVEFLREFFEKKDKINVSYWQKEIDQKRDEIKKYMKRGIKKINRIKETEIDTYIIDSWNEVVSIIKSKIEKPVDDRNELSRIEALLRKVLAEGKIVVSSSQRTIEKPIERISSEESHHRHDGAEEEVEELEDISESAESASVPSTVEEMDEFEELSELEEVFEPQAASDKEAMQDLVVVSEEIGQRGALSSSDELGSSSDDGLIVPEAEVETDSITESYLGDTEELPEMDAFEDVTEFDDIEELVDAEPVDSADLEPARGPETSAASAKEKGSDQIEALEIVPEIKQLPPFPFEKLEELPLVDEEEKRLLNETTAMAEFTASINRGEIVVMEIESLMKNLSKTGENVVLEDGIYRIKEELYHTEKKVPAQKGLKALAESILQTQEKKLTGISSIDELYRIDDFLEESERKILNERSREIKREIPKKKVLPITSSGIDLDSYLQCFSYHVTDKVMIHSIGELIKKAKAVCAVLLTKEESLKVELAIGLTNRSAIMFHFKLEGSFFKEFLATRKIIIINDVFQKLTIFTQKLVSDDFRFIKSALFLPALIDKKESYLFMGFPAMGQLKNINLVFDVLDISLPVIESRL